MSKPLYPSATARSPWGRWVLVCWLVVAWPAAGQDPEPIPVHRSSLENGLEVLVVENHASPMATVLVAVRTGAFTQGPGERGLAHLFEHVLFRSFGREPTDFAERVARMQGSFNGATSVDVVTYHIMVPAEKVDDAIDLLGRLVRSASFRSRDLEEEVPIVLDELARTEAVPEDAFRRRMELQMAGDAWHQRDLLGDSTALTGMTLDQVRDAFARFYIPNNAALIVTGDVDPEEVAKAAEDEFGKWEAGPAPFDSVDLREARPPLTGVRAVMVPNVVFDVTIRIALAGPDLRDDPRAAYAVDALADFLNTSDSRLQAQLVGSGLLRSLRFGYDPTAVDAGIVVEGVASPRRAVDAVRFLVDALDKLDAFIDFTPEDFAIADKQRRVGQVLARERAATFAPVLAEWWAGPGLDAMDDWGEDTTPLTVDDLGAAAARYILGQPRVIGVLGPQAIIDQVAADLRGNP